MLENFYTTKMSANKKKIQNRFLKIRSKNGRTARVIAVIIFVMVLISIGFASVYMAVKTGNEYAMSETDFVAYTGRPIGSVMAEIDYADDEKVVFHYLEGFFITNEETKELKYKIDISKLNVARHGQGDTVLDVKVDKDGNYAYLTSVGLETEKFDEYVINLNNGNVKKGRMPENTELFTQYADTVSVTQGWNDYRCVINNKKNYYLNFPYGTIGNIQLVITDERGEARERIRYVFGEKYISRGARNEKIILNVLPKGDKLVPNSGRSWNIDAEKLKDILNVIAKYNQSRWIDIIGNDFEVSIYQIRSSNERTMDGLFIIDNRHGEVMFQMSGSNLDENIIPEALNILDRNDDLYDKTVEFLNEEFHRVYDKYYDIYNMFISNWSDTANEATFLYTMEYLHYNRNPDTVEYIQEAKKRSQSEYETLYNDYLAPKQSNYEFRIVLNGDKLDLYYNVAPKGREWQPVKVDDFVGID